MFKDSSEESFGESVVGIPTDAEEYKLFLYMGLVGNPHFHRTYDYGSSCSTYN
jgi:hypothetical protein